MKFEAPKGQRLHKRFVWITVMPLMWWNEDDRSWSNDPKPGSSTCCNCKSLKSFKRHLGKHPELDGEVILVSRFVGYNVSKICHSSVNM